MWERGRCNIQVMGPGSPSFVREGPEYQINLMSKSEEQLLRVQKEMDRVRKGGRKKKRPAVGCDGVTGRSGFGGGRREKRWVPEGRRAEMEVRVGEEVWGGKELRDNIIRHGVNRSVFGSVLSKCISGLER